MVVSCWTLEKQHVVEGEEVHEEDLEGVEVEVAFEGPVVEVVVDPLVGEGGEVVLVVAPLVGLEEEVDPEQIMLPHCNGNNSSRDGGIVVQQGSLRSVKVALWFALATTLLSAVDWEQKLQISLDFLQFIVICGLQDYLTPYLEKQWIWSAC